MSGALLHKVLGLERWDTLAFQYYGQASAYQALIEANPHLNISPVLPSGAIVLIPIEDTSSAPSVLAAEELPPWKR